MKLCYSGDQMVEKMNYVEYMRKNKIRIFQLGNLKKRDNFEELEI